jgi:DNA-binding CsgD family transcriptional regulator
VIGLGHGMSEKEVARRLEIAPATVNDHLKHARARFGVRKSSLLIVCGLLTGAIGYSELLTD